MSKPKVRFKGYTETWEQRKLNEVAEKVSEKNRDNQYDEPFTNSAELGIVSQQDYFDREVVNEENLDGYYVVRDDDFVYNPRVSVTAPVGPINRNKLGRNGVMSPLYTVFRTHDVDHGYLEYYFKTTSWHKFMKLNGDSGARFDRFSISSSLFMEMPIPYPSMEEQVKIGAYFSTLDHLITLHQRKCEETKMLKKYMLKKMFPNDGECIPEIRFSGFTDAWEQRKLGEVITTGTVLRVFKEQWQGEGIPFFRSIDVVSEYKGVANPKDKAFISKEVYDDLTSRCGKIKKGDVLVTGGGSIGTPYLVKSNDPLYFKDGDLLWLIPEEKITGEYLYRFFTTPLFIKYVNSITHKGTIAHYTIEQVKATPIKLPTVEEQTKLAEYFATLDHLITLHQRKYEELQNIKKFMLQNMFV